MHTFKDRNDNEYSIVLDIYTVKQIKQTLGIDLMSVFDSEENITKFGDPYEFINILYLVCEDQAKKYYPEETEKSFGRALDMKLCDKASEVFMEALVDFFQDAKSKRLRKIIEAGKRYQEKQLEMLDREIDKAIEDMESGKLLDNGNAKLGT